MTFKAIASARATDAGPHAFAWRSGAATLHGFDSFAPGGEGFRPEPELAVRYPQSSPAHGVARLRNVGEHDLVLVQGVWATSPPRTLTDLGTIAGEVLVERAVESAIRKGLVTDPELRAIATLPARRGAPVLRRVMALRPPGAPPTGSELETRMVQLCRGRVPEPVRQLPVELLGDRYKIDLSWPQWAVAAELDSRRWHGPETFDSDRRRSNKLATWGWTVLHFTWADVVEAPAATLRILATALHRHGCPGLVELMLPGATLTKSPRRTRS